MSLIVGLPALLALLLIGLWAAAALDTAIGRLIVGRPVGMAATDPLRAVVADYLRQRTDTEAPDPLNWLLAPGYYFLLAVVGLALVPFAPDQSLIALDTSVVLWGAAEAVVVVAVFLHGWSPNAPFPLIGAYRYVAIGLPVMLLSMFVLIAASIPAQSLDLRAVVESQRGLWNVIRQPLGLPLFLAVVMSLTLRGPFDYADSADLAGGTSAEDGGPRWIAWQTARAAMLVAACAIAATAFLGGYLGPVLPGWLWLSLKTLAVMVAVVLLTHLVPRMPVARMLTLIWIVLLPIAFLDLLIAGLGAL